MKNELNSKSLLRIVVIGILVYCGIENYNIVLNIISYLLSLIFPFLLGGAIAFIINVPMRAIESRLFPKKKDVDSLRRICAYLLTLILIIGILSLCLFVIIPQVSATAKLIAAQVPSALISFQKWLYNVTDNVPNIQNFIDELDVNWTSISSYAVNILKTAGSTVFSSGITVISSIVGGVTNFVIAFIFSIYILLQKEKLSTQCKKTIYAYYNEGIADRILYIARLSNKIFSNFLSGQCIEAVILGTMFFVTLSIFHLPYAVLIGVVISLTALIPIFGAFIGCAIGAFLIVMVDPMQALWFLIIFFVLQQIEGNLIYPYVVGGSIGLPSIWVLAAVIIGGNLLGVAGILVFIPLCSVCYTLFREYVYKRLRERNVDSSKWEKIPDIVIENDEKNTKSTRQKKQHQTKRNQIAKRVNNKKQG